MIKAETFEGFVRAYWREAVRVYERSEASEPSGYPALAKLLKDCVGKVEKNLIAITQPKQENRKAPDFVIKDGALLLGYVEVKKPSDKLEDVLGSEQIKGYLQLSKNLLVTNCESWALCVGSEKETGKPRWERARLGSLKRSGDFDVKGCERLCRMLEIFLHKMPEHIGHIRDMAETLALRAKRLRDNIIVEGRLQGLFKALRKQIDSNLTVDVFKDTYTQTVVYGLFLARLNAPVADKITLLNAKKYITSSFPVIKELADFLYELEGEKYDHSRLYVEEILGIINHLDLSAIEEQMTFKYWHDAQENLWIGDEEKRLFARDPFVYFYEDFLAAYDREKRKMRGVYFTPPPIVHFIVKSIEEILQDKHLFNISDGLANKEHVTLLDFATGTGTFLAEVIRVILDRPEYQSKGNVEAIVEGHILKNIYGFEFLIAPYVAAHLKLSQVLKEYNYHLEDGKEMPVLLTNTLEKGSPQKNLFISALSDEAEKSEKVKNKKILIITGNPPYNVHPFPKDESIDEKKERIEKKKKELLSYKETFVEMNGENIKEELSEQKHWLSDDYVRFIEFAQKKVDKFDDGIVAVITNHGFISNPTFRIMRQSLLHSFDQIYILDLHGNFRRKEKTPEGGKDENIFDIQQGVAISFFIKKPGIKKGVWHAEFWGTRKEKYKKAFDYSWKSLKWKNITPLQEYKSLRLFVPHDTKNKNSYEKGWLVPDIFPVNNCGIATGRDKFTIQYSEQKMYDIVKEFAGLDERTARLKFNIGKDTDAWNLVSAQENIKENGFTIKNNILKKIFPVLYRPFDVRYTYYTDKTSGFLFRPRYEVMRHMLRNNIGLITCRHRPFGKWCHVFVTKNLLDNHFSSYCDYLFPLYLYQPQQGEKPINPKFFGEGDIFQGEQRRENISLSFREYLTQRYPRSEITPEQILAYVYAILHDTNYRQHYQEFLKYNFPRIPFPNKFQNFAKLSNLGQKMIDVHMLKNHNAKLLYGSSNSNRRVEEIRYSESEKRLYINKASYFENVSESVYSFHIGGYRVLEKYLKERKKRSETILDPRDGTTPASTLDSEEIYHFSYIVDALSKTQVLMKKIAETTLNLEIYRS